MDSRLGICHLSNGSRSLRNFMPKLQTLLESFGFIVRLELLKKDSKFEFLIEFESPESLALCVETLQGSHSELGELTVNELPEETESSPTVHTNGNDLYFVQQRPSSLAKKSDFLHSNNTSKHESFANCSPKSPSSLNCSNKLTVQPTFTPGVESHSAINSICFIPKNLPGLLEPVEGYQGITTSTFFDYLQEFSTTTPMTNNHGQSQYNYLLLKNLSLSNTKLGCILNLLGSFGNVTNYIIDRKNEKGAFGFTIDSKINLFVNFMQGQLFFGAHLICSHVASRIELLKVKNDKPERFIVGSENEKNHRYQPNLVIKFNPPSKLVHVTNVAGCVDHRELQKIFGKFYPPTWVKKLKQRSSTASEMFLVEFDQPHKAIEILSLFHNQNIAERSIKVSFSHTKIDSNSSRIDSDTN